MRISRLLLTTIALTSLLTLAAPGAAAQSWYVQSADYGAGNRRQDVTQTVRRLVSGPNFRVNNTTMGGDPWPGADKTLRIVGRDAQGNVRDFKYGEGSTVTSSMFRGQPWNGGGPGWNDGGNGSQVWWVQSAEYGAGNRRQDVTQTVRRLVSGPNFRVNNTTMGGDPWPGADKTLRIVGRDSLGNVRDFKYGEGSTVNSSLFRGSAWGGGPGRPDNNLELKILSAKWGSGTAFQNVTSRLRGLVRNNRLSVKVTPQNMGGDPTPGVSKRVMVNYLYQGQLQKVTRVEGEMLELP